MSLCNVGAGLGATLRPGAADVTPDHARAMQVHAFLPDDSHRRLLVALGQRHKAIRVNTVADLARVAATGEVSAAVIDPACGRPGSIDALAVALELGAFPVLLYTALDGSSVRELLELQRRSGAEDFVAQTRRTA